MTYQFDGLVACSLFFSHVAEPFLSELVEVTAAGRPGALVSSGGVFLLLARSRAT